jgi:hypothetical protein
MPDAVYLALIAATSGIVGPMLMAWLQNRNMRAVKEQDYARQDEVARSLLERQDAISAKAIETAALLRVNTAAVASAATETHSQLRVIHALVNSNMTAALQAELVARRAAQVLMTEVADLKRASGHKPSESTEQEAVVNRAKIDELEAVLADRLKQAKEIDDAAGQSKAAS